MPISFTRIASPVGALILVGCIGRDDRDDRPMRIDGPDFAEERAMAAAIEAEEAAVDDAEVAADEAEVLAVVDAAAGEEVSP